MDAVGSGFDGAGDGGVEVGRVMEAEGGAGATDAGGATGRVVARGTEATGETGGVG